MVIVDFIEESKRGVGVLVIFSQKQWRIKREREREKWTFGGLGMFLLTVIKLHGTFSWGSVGHLPHSSAACAHLRLFFRKRLFLSTRREKETRNNSPEEEGRAGWLAGWLMRLQFRFNIWLVQILPDGKCIGSIACVNELPGKEEQRVIHPSTVLLFFFFLFFLNYWLTPHYIHSSQSLHLMISISSFFKYKLSKNNDFDVLYSFVNEQTKN